MIERDKLLNMAREADHKNGGSEFVAMNSGMLGKFANAILERAALLCENMQQEHTPKDCAYLIRALASAWQDIARRR